jgi:predicted Rdx family selenoprotein
LALLVQALEVGGIFEVVFLGAISERKRESGGFRERKETQEDGDNGG